MTKLLRKILLSAVVLCISLGAAIFAAACGEETCKYSVTVACEELSQAQLDTLGVKLVGSDGKASEGKTLKNARADFELSPATYTVELYGDLLEDYTYSATSVTKEKPDVTVTLSPKAQEPDDGDKKDKIDYTVTVTCESAPNVLSGISVRIYAEGSETPVAAQPLTNGSARFSLAPGNYTVTLSDTLGMLAEFDYDSDITLTADAPSVTVVLTPKVNDPIGSEDNPIELTDTLAGDYEFTPQKIEADVGYDHVFDYTKVYYTYTPAADETYTFTSTINYLTLTIEDESGETVLYNLSGNDRFYKVFTLTAGTKYTMYAQIDDGNSVYHDGDPLTWKIQSGEQPQPDVTFTVTVTCDDSALLATLKAGLYKADGTLASEEKALVNGSASFTLAPATYTVKLSGEGLDEYSYAEKTVSQASPTAEINLTKKADIKKWKSGKGTESDPYVVDPLTGRYSVPTKGFDPVYIKYVAAEAGKYTLTAESDDFYMSMTQGNTALVTAYGTAITKTFDVVAGTVMMEVKNWSENDAPVTFTITRADGSFDPESSAPSTPDLTAFVGTWTDDQGHKIVVTADSLSYFENDDPYDTTIDGLEGGILKFTYTEELLGNVFEYHWGLVFDEATLVLVDLETQGTGKDYYNGYYIVSTLSRDEGGDVGGGDVTIPDGLDGVWTAGTGDETTIKVTFAGTDVMMTLYDVDSYGAVTAYDAESGVLTVTMEDNTEYNFIFEDGALTLYIDEGDGDYTEVPFTKGSSTPTEQDGTAAHPFVWDAFEGTLEANLPAETYIYYSYTAKKSGIYSLTYTLNGGSCNDLNLFIYPEGDSAHPVASWNTFGQSYAFPLTSGTTYIFRLRDDSATAAGGKLLLTVKEETLSFPTAYEGTWVDAEQNPTYTLVVSGTTVTVNGSAVSNLTLASFNGGYTFVWNSKNCNIAIGRTQSGGYESSMLFTFGDGEDDYVTLYHPGSVPAIEYGTEEHPQSMTQSDLAKDWSDSLSKGEYYWTFTATETKTYTLSTTIDYLCITITDTTAGKDIVDWQTSENLKEVVFEITAGHAYVIYYTDGSSDMFSKTVTFKIAEGGTIEKADIPQEILAIEWVDATNPKNTITLSVNEVKIHVDIQGILSADYNGSVTKAEQTADGYTITFATASANLTLVYNRANKTLTFNAPSTTYTFTDKAASGSTWTGDLPAKWSGTWELNESGAVAQSITISGNTITWTTGAGAGKTFTVTGYDETSMVISFKTSDGLAGTIERQFDYENDDFTAIKVTFNGTTYSNLRKQGSTPTPPTPQQFLI